MQLITYFVLQLFRFHIPIYFKSYVFPELWQKAVGVKDINRPFY